MRVLHVIPSLCPERGGPVFTLALLARTLNAFGVETHIATTDDDGRGRRSLPLGRPVQSNGVTHWFFQRQTRFYTLSLPLAAWLARNVRYFDLVHTHGLFSFAPLAAAAFAERAGVPFLLRPLGTLERWGMRHRRPLFKQISFALCEQRAIRHAAAVQFTSKRELHEAKLIAAAGRAVVLPNPVALPISEPHAPSLHKRYPVLAGRTVALMLSRIDAKKGHDLLIRAFARAHARRPELALLVAGSGDTALLARLQGLADELGVGRAIVWAGFLEGEAKLAALGEADLFVLPSLSENFANAVVEAMAAACPVIVSEQVGIQDAVAEAGAGLVVPTDEAALAQALVRLVDDPEGRRIMGAKGQAYARAHFAPEVVARQLVQIYLGLLARARRSQQAAQPTKR